MIKKVNELELKAFPMKVVVKSSSIDLWVKRSNRDWILVVSIKAARNNINLPWSVRYYEMGTAKYIKFRTWEDVKQFISNHYLVELPDNINENLLAKITMIKISN